VRAYWPQIIAALTFAFALGGSYVQLDTHADEIKANAEAIEEEKKEDEEDRKALVRLETNQNNMKEDLGEIKAMLKELRE